MSSIYRLMVIEIDKSQWSRNSQNSSGGHYDAGATHYENIALRCCKCFCSCVFTDEEQKEEYEINKKFVWWLPSRCSACHEELNSLIQKDHKYQQLWNTDKESVKKDKSIMRDWLHVIREVQSYGKKTNESMIICLLKWLNET